MLSDTVRAGNAFYRRVRELDNEKAGISKAEFEALLTGMAADFVREGGLELRVTVAFCDVHALLGRQTHTQLAVVRLDGRSCQVSYHAGLIESRDPNAGLVFVAKSWVLFMVIAHMLEDHPGVQSHFVFEAGDTGSLDQVSFNSNNPRACLILDDEFAATDGYAPFRRQCELHLPPWESRQPQVLWRGSTTGRRSYTPLPGERDDLSWLPRLQLCKAANAPDLRALCDVGISAIAQVEEKYLVERIAASGLMKERVPREHYPNYRGVFDIDGNANAWSGLFCGLLGASCVLKVASAAGYRQWYYAQLEPWVNFVPVTSDLSDLATAVRWFAAHEAESRAIGARGRQLAVNIDLAAAVAVSARNLLNFCQRQRVG